MPGVLTNKSGAWDISWIRDTDEAELALQNGADGIGLFRSEFLYMECDSLPSEETQFRAYRRFWKKCRGRESLSDVGHWGQQGCSERSFARCSVRQSCGDVSDDHFSAGGAGCKKNSGKAKKELCEEGSHSYLTFGFPGK
nr:putative PEP-binding protein [uncultured Caproiciproducens sp.]